ncbi:SixA phosphatase family protein [Pontibacter sp. MBLB2868]|uniref:SixA phosphatase family protein n=1 Tax=Pontibacter sp. MBLB2868 TaxID=3451555 RepID=UPI003F74C9AA
MQRKILICRHAETFEPYPFQSDFERELTPNGTKQARATGVWLRENFNKIDYCLVSPAKRAQATARLIADKIYFDTENITYEPDLYNAQEKQLLKCLSNLPQHVKSVLLVAHNPGITRLARELTDRMVGYLEPANVLAVEIDLQEWEDIYITTGLVSAKNMLHA